MFNIAILTGRCVNTPELRTTQNGTSVCNFTIAVDRRYKQGEEKQVDFINITAWRGTAEFVSKHFIKGQMIDIEGSIQTRKYQDKDGNNRTAVEVVASKIHFVGSKKSESNEEGNSLPTTENGSLDELQNDLELLAEIGDDTDDLPF